MADASSRAAYEAALITQNRALQARQDAIDVMRRLLEEFDTDPLITKAKEALTDILENPDVITDEVFNNIMSKTTEVLDANFDSQVSEMLGYARKNNISGSALQLGLQRAKNARATAIAGAYRDAIIQRSQEGLKTQTEALNSTMQYMTNFFQQKRVVSEDLANVLNTVVEAPFENFGPPAVAEPGTVGGTRPIPVNYNTPGSEGFNLQGFSLNQDKKLVYDAVTGQLVTPEVAAQEKFRREQEMNQKNADARSRDALVRRDDSGGAYQDLLAQIRGLSGPAAKKVSPDGSTVNGVPVDQWLKMQSENVGAQSNALSPAVSPTVSNLTPGGPTIQDASVSGQTAEGQAGAISNLQRVSGPGYSTINGQDYAYGPDAGGPKGSSTIQGAGLDTGSVTFGGGADAVSRSKKLIAQFGAGSLIGTTAGPGVKQTSSQFNRAPGVSTPGTSTGQRLVQTMGAVESGPVIKTSAGPGVRQADPVTRNPNGSITVITGYQKADLKAGGKRTANTYTFDTQQQYNEWLKKQNGGAGSTIVTSSGTGVRHE